MQLSNLQENTPIERKLYLGVENFQVTAVNPTMKELNDMGIPVTTEPEYNVKVKRNFGTGEKEYDAVNIRLYLSNNDPSNMIRTQVNYQIVKDFQLSTTDKYKVINKYGSSTWLEEGQINGTLPANLHWYVNEEVKKCYRGEDTLIDFIKAYRNLPNIAVNSKPDTKKKGIAILNQTDLDKMFKGDFTDIRNAIMSQEGQVGYLLGVRHLDDKDVQTVYKQLPVKRYIKKTDKTEYLVAEVARAQENGAFSDTTFDLKSTKLKEYSPTEDKVTPDTTASGVAYANVSDTDDLPF